MRVARGVGGGAEGCDSDGHVPGVRHCSPLALDDEVASVWNVREIRHLLPGILRHEPVQLLRGA